MNKFTEIIDTYLLNYMTYCDGKISFECEHGELIFNKKDNKMITLFGIYIYPEYRQNGLCRSILQYLIDKSAYFNYLCVESVLSKVLYKYLLRFKYKNKKFKKTQYGFIFKIQ
jgi:hypothetical protein